jgi:hypothetical protein
MMNEDVDPKRLLELLKLPTVAVVVAWLVLVTLNDEEKVLPSTLTLTTNIPGLEVGPICH